MVRPGERYWAVGVATNIRQARLLVSAARSIVEASPVFRRMVESVTEDELRFSNGTAIAAFPCSSSAGRGWPIACLVADELAFMQDATDGPAVADRVWTALVPSTAQFGREARLIASSTPNGTDNLFARLYREVESGEIAGRAFHYATADVNPTVDRELLRMEERRDPHGFRSEYLAEFVGSGGSFFDLRGVELDEVPWRPEDGRNWCAGLDPAFAQDQFGVCLVGESVSEPGTLLVGAVAGIDPGARLLSLQSRRRREDATLASVWELIAPYVERPGGSIMSDQHQGDAVRSYFGRKGVSVSIQNLTGPLQARMFLTVRTRLSDGSLRLHRDEPLLTELARIRSRDSETLVLPRVGGSHCDRASALAVACWRHLGVDGSPPGAWAGGPNRVDDRFVGELGPVGGGLSAAPAYRRNRDRAGSQGITPPPGWRRGQSLRDMDF